MKILKIIWIAMLLACEASIEPCVPVQGVYHTPVFEKVTSNCSNSENLLIEERLKSMVYIAMSNVCLTETQHEDAEGYAFTLKYNVNDTGVYLSSTVTGKGCWHVG